MAISSYAELQQFITNILKENGNHPEDAPHGSFWDNLSYEQFVTGNVPGVGPYPILIKGNSAQSNIILALKGEPPFDGSVFNQMPADGPPYFTDEQIQEIADWIDAGCPNGTSATEGTDSEVDGDGAKAGISGEDRSYE